MIESSFFVGIDRESAVIRAVTGADPAADTECEHSVPGGRAWLLIAYFVQLVTDANAANRRPCLVVTDGNNRIARAPSQGVIAASQTVQLTWGNGLDSNGDGTGAQSMGLFKQAVLLPGWTVGTTTVNRQATDNYGVPVAWVIEFDYNR